MAGWSDLRPELLDLIFARVKDPTDIRRCRFVCKSWSINASQSQVYRKYFPLCLIDRRGSAEEEEDCCRTLFRISTEETAKIHLPEAKGLYIHSFSNGWLLSARSDRSLQMRLINLSSRAQILLPLLPGFPGKAIVSTCPCTSNLVVLLQYGFRVAFWRAGDESWTDFVDLLRPYPYFEDIMLYKGQFYGVDGRGHIFYFQLSPEAKALQITKSDFSKYCLRLVESVEGDFLFVCGFLRRDESQKEFHLHPKEFEIYKLDLTRKSLEKVKDLRSQTLIICDGLCACVPAGGSGSTSRSIFKGNCMLFEEYCGGFCLRMHCFETGQTKSIFSSYGKELRPLFW